MKKRRALVVPQVEYYCEDDDFYGLYDAVWHIAIDGANQTVCGNQPWFAASRAAPVEVCPECLRLDAEHDGTA